jgi:hypothetical protein
LDRKARLRLCIPINVVAKIRITWIEAAFQTRPVGIAKDSALIRLVTKHIVAKIGVAWIKTTF